MTARSSSTRRPGRLAAALVLVGGLLALGLASPAVAADPNADPSSANQAQGEGNRILYPTVETVRARPERNVAARAATTSTSLLTYRGGNHGIGVTTGPPRVYLVFWGSQWGIQTGTAPNATFSGDPSGMAPRLQQMFASLGTGELWSGVMTQYCEGVSIGATSCPATGAAHVGYPTGGSLAGVLLDPATLPAGGATGTQLAAEAVKAAGHFGNTSASSNRNVQYVVLSPTGTHPDGFNNPLQWCAWHDWNGSYGVSSSYGDIAFTNLPYLTDVGASCGANFVNGSGALDGVTIVSGHEYAETITDQNPIGGWFDTLVNQENGDKCAWISPGAPGGAANVPMGTSSFPMQSTWSNDSASCLLSHPIVSTSTNDFSINATPLSQTTTPNGSTTYTITVTPTANYTGQVTLTLGASARVASSGFSPTSLSFTNGSPASATSTLTVTAYGTPGTYPLSITGTDTTNSLAHAANVTLVVAAPNFSISASPNSSSVRHGRSTSFTVTVTPNGTYSGNVTLSRAASAGVAGSTFSANPLLFTTGTPTSRTSTLRVTASSSRGTYTLTITGTDGSGRTHTTTITLTVW